MRTQRELTVDELVQMNRAAINGTKPKDEKQPAFWDIWDTATPVVDRVRFGKSKQLVDSSKQLVDNLFDPIDVPNLDLGDAAMPVVDNMNPREFYLKQQVARLVPQMVEALRWIRDYARETEEKAVEMKARDILDQLEEQGTSLTNWRRNNE